MAKIKLTKGEMKLQRDNLKQFNRYLPTLQLKKQQIQTKILEVVKHLNEKLQVLEDKEKDINEWSGLFADTAFDLGFEQKPDREDIIEDSDIQVTYLDFKDLITPTEIITDTVNIAGANVPIYKDVKFKSQEYDLYLTPLWIDRAIIILREFMAIVSEVQVIKKEIKVLKHELRVTTQRVNLFEKVKIPESKENIRKISIYLGDQQANAVGVSKVAKKKIEQRVDKEVLV